MNAFTVIFINIKLAVTPETSAACKRALLFPHVKKGVPSYDRLCFFFLVKHITVAYQIAISWDRHFEKIAD
ncbi:hypothetical protein T4C_2474 [Trichinella pseudospiralis]|uniref:Uncharacterized protein n=1 Tax=Trichinella pseudospiralis TaxID=6337 RepID=A0A0V1I1D5_TRIPS|nr:hypothetical protein T4C_2474 [Trichinella pseudospiralis]